MFRKHKPTPRIVHIIKREGRDAAGAKIPVFQAVWKTERGEYIETVATGFHRAEVEDAARRQGFTVATQS